MEDIEEQIMDIIVDARDLVMEAKDMIESTGDKKYIDRINKIFELLDSFYDT